MRGFSVRTERKTQLVDITRRVQEEVAEAGIENGLCFLFVPHTTAGLTINEGADPSVKTDLIRSLDQMVPGDLPYQHAEGNSPAHVKSSLVGTSLTLPVVGGRLALGRWQSVFFCEFDGPRERRVWLKIVEG